MYSKTRLSCFIEKLFIDGPQLRIDDRWQFNDLVLPTLSTSLFSSHPAPAAAVKRRLRAQSRLSLSSNSSCCFSLFICYFAFLDDSFPPVMSHADRSKKKQICCGETALNYSEALYVVVTCVFCLFSFGSDVNEIFTATCFSNVAVMGSLDVHLSVCLSVCL